MYNSQQKNALALLFKEKFMSGEAEGYEIVVALMAMVKDKRLIEIDIKDILMIIHSNNVEGVMRSLNRAHKLIDEDMIDSIIKEVSSH